MKKYILSFAILAFCFVWSCRSKEVVPSIPDTVDTLLLKTLAVKGASDVKIDHDKGIIQVTLPESYSSEFIDLDFTVQKSSLLSYNSYGEGQKTIANVNNPENLTHRFTYEGVRPLNINVQKELGLKSKDYIVYVNHINGKSQVRLGRIDSISYSFAADFYLDVQSSAGTIPNKADTKLPYALLRKTGNLNPDTSNLYYTNRGFIGGFNLAKYVPFENQTFKIESVINGQTIVVSENFRFLTKKVIVESNHGKLLATFNKNFDLKGGIFVASKKYIVKLSNDYINGNIELRTQVKDVTTLNVEANPSIKSGGYLIDVYENDNLIYRGVINIVNDGLISAIRNFIKYDNSPFDITPPPTSSTKKEQFVAGDSLLILPVNYQIICCANSYVEILRNVEAPKLRLMVNSKQTDLTPIAKSFGWGGIMSIIYFQYTIPKSTESGFYEAQLIYPDGRESLKYWNKIEIK